MKENLTKLLSIGSLPLGDNRVTSMSQPIAMSEGIFNQLTLLLSEKNGFFAFESALRVFPSGTTSFGCDLTEWNSSNLWRSSYRRIPSQLIFFAEDIFGEQFALDQDCIYRFNPETGALDNFAKSLDEWAKRILKDYDVEVGYTIGREWQQQNRPLKASERLLPIQPFVLGGKFATENLYALDAVQGMQLRGDFANKIAEYPDGTKVEIKVVD